MNLIFGGGEIAEKIRGYIMPHSVCDVTNITMIRIALDTYTPDVVTNCAGILTSGSIKEQLYDDWFQQIYVNLFGSYFVAKACIEKDVKTMIFISSVAGLLGKAYHSAYGVSKAGVISLVQSLADEGYNAYCISPGRVDTEMRQQEMPDEDKRTRLKPQEVAHVVEEIIQGKYKPGDNIIIRKHGFKTIKSIDRGYHWDAYEPSVNNSTG